VIPNLRGAIHGYNAAFRYAHARILAASGAVFFFASSTEKRPLFSSKPTQIRLKTGRLWGDKSPHITNSTTQ
jgi:hypothetical protein